MIKLTMNKRDGTTYVLDYLPEEHRLIHDDIDSILQKVNEQEWFNTAKSELHDNNPNTVAIRIALGKECNFKCVYCHQRDHYAENIEITTDKLQYLVNEIVRVSKDRIINSIQFWGGETLLYLDTIKELHTLFKQSPSFDDIVFSICTNGSLLTNDTTDWLLANNVTCNISYDGPGQHLRGKDILSDPVILSNVIRLFNHKNATCVILPVLTKENNDFINCYKFIKDKINDDSVNVIMGELALLMVSDEQSMNAAIPMDELPAFSTKLFSDFITDKTTTHRHYLMYILLFLMQLNKPCNNKIQTSKCFAGSNRTLTTDIDGNILVCQSFNNGDTYFDGEPYKLCHISELDSSTSRPVPELKSLMIKQNNKCKKCAVFQLCRGGCPYANLEYEEYNCAANFYLYSALLGTAMFMLTGDVLSHIDTVELD